MFEKYDLDELLKDVDLDEEFDKKHFSSKVSQDDISRILQERKKKARKEE